MAAFKENINVVNRRASFNYFITDTVEAGIILTGTEIKAIREGKASLTDAYCIFKGDELWIRQLHISAYDHGGYANHVPRAERKLLLHRNQLTKFQSKLREKGVTIIPTRLYISERSLAKIEIGLARGKKLFDKRQSIKENEAKKEIGRLLKK